MHSLSGLETLAGRHRHGWSALVLALPNVFGDAPALQLSRNDRAAFTEQTKAAVTGILRGQEHSR